jgi:molecular chaperone DnaK (HSP70)
MSMSEFIEAMVEAGMKKFSASVEPDETNQELREQRHELKTELDRTRNRIRELEDMVYHGERRTINRYVEDNPGATYDEIIQHVVDTVPSRVSTHLDDLEGGSLRYEEDGYYPVEEESDS